MGHIGLCVFFFFFCWIAAAALGGEAAPTSRREGGWFVDWEEEAIRSFDNDLEEEYRWIDINERIWKKEAKWQIRRDLRDVSTRDNAQQRYQDRLKVIEQYGESERAAARKRVEGRRAQWERPFNQENYLVDHRKNEDWSAEEINDVVLDQELARIVVMARKRNEWARKHKDGLVKLLGSVPTEAEKDYQKRKRAISDAEDVGKKNARIRHMARAIRIWNVERQKRSKNEPDEGKDPPLQFSLSSLSRRIGDIIKPLGQSVPGLGGLGLSHSPLHPGSVGGVFRTLSLP